jgi:5'-3' exonuclease
MGIPSFYKHLLQSVPGLTKSTRSHKTQVFALDLNCAIYHCIRKVAIPYSQESRTAWENLLIQHVLAYIKQMTKIVAPTESIYIAVDGVAPMAKIKQQRARRFKSMINAREEAQIRAEAKGVPYDPDATPRWDSNAITPGTDFMKRLATALREFSYAGVRVIVSPADEPGEGEQKIMEWVRKQSASLTDIAVYGLDADLIVLALLEHARSDRRVDLFREQTEFGGAIQLNEFGEEQFLFLDIEHLGSALVSAWAGHSAVGKQRFLRDFVGIMNLLGNDFVPHGMGLKINDEGIEQALEALRSMRHTGKEELVTADGQYDSVLMFKLLTALSANEPRNIVRCVRKKLEARIGASNSKDPEARAMSLLNDRPVLWAAERVLVEERTREGYEKPRLELRNNWRQIYNHEALWGADLADSVNAYCKTLVWTLRYYFGKTVDMCWYYPWPLPPLMTDVANALCAAPSLLADAPPQKNFQLKPLEQLAMVLPLTSFHLLPEEYRGLSDKYPHAWPISWSTYSFGRRFLWECEPLIPLIQPKQMREWMDECLE